MTQGDPTWYRLELLTTSPDEILGLLADAGALGVEVQDRDTYMEDGSIAPVPDGKTRLIAFFDEPFESALVDDVDVVSNARYDDRSWQTAWKKYFRPVRVSPRATVGPPWEEFEAPAGGVKIEIEPGMAFGTGTHETTRLSATLLDELIASEEPESVLDVGCGTGVLSMIAVGLGAPKVAGIDVDETAVEIARENLRRNDLGPAAHFSATPLDRLGVYSIVVANILAHVLLQLRDDLVDRISAGGHLVTSGITTDQADEFVAEFSGEDVELVERRTLGDWVAVVWRRNG